ncbi:MAG: MauE/DoxX family redox-associated membrane protein [Bryobacteraceae bacterium]
MALAGGAKLLNIDRFCHIVQGYNLLPDRAANVVGHTIPIFELLAAGSLLSGWLVWAGAGLSALLFGTFGVAVTANLLRGRRNIPCGCFQSFGSDHLTWGLVTRNVILTGLAIVVARSQQQLFGNSNFPLWQSAWRDIPAHALLFTAMVSCTPIAVAILAAAFRRIGGEASIGASEFSH